jgi:hypothetical protein
MYWKVTVVLVETGIKLFRGFRAPERQAWWEVLSQGTQSLGV